MWGWANHRWGMGIGCGSRRAWRWIMPCSQCRQNLAQLVMSLESLRQTNLEETRHRVVQMQKDFSEFCWDNRTENPSWNVANQIRKSKCREKILRQVKWRDNYYFWKAWGCNRNLMVTHDKINFQKNIATIQTVWKGTSMIGPHTVRSHTFRPLTFRPLTFCS